MTTVVLDDEFMDEIINVSHYQNAQEAVFKILADYTYGKKAQHSILDFLVVDTAVALIDRVLKSKLVNLDSKPENRRSYFKVRPLPSLAK
jgi:hypothetical protein